MRLLIKEKNSSSIIMNKINENIIHENNNNNKSSRILATETFNSTKASLLEHYYASLINKKTS